MILIRQRSRWEKGERSLAPFDAMHIALETEPSLHPIVEAMHDLRLHTGLPPARLELSDAEWQKIKASQSFQSAVKYCGPLDAKPEGATPADLGRMLGVEVMVR